MALEVSLPTLLAGFGIQHYNRQNLGRTTPDEMPSSGAYDALDNAAIARSASIAPESDPMLIARKEYVPKAGEKVITDNAASHQSATLKKTGQKVDAIRINPNADRSYYAHELGHGISQKNKVGKFINDARHVIRGNPKLARALSIALPGALAGTGAALQAGDDDFASSIAIAAAAASPTLIDEALASKNALAIMQDAGMRATAGQRGRLAGGYLSYLAPVLLAGSVGNAFGNAVDEHTALYDL